MFVHYDKRNGNVSEQRSYRVPGEKYPRKEYVSIGKIVDGVFVGNRYFNEREKNNRLQEKVDEITRMLQDRIEGENQLKEQNRQLEESSNDPRSRKHAGLTYALSHICQEEGMTKALETVFGTEGAKKLLSLAFFLISTGSGAFDDFSYYDRTSEHPYRSNIGPSSISCFLSSVKESQIEEFYKTLLRSEPRSGKDEDNFIAFDGTTISSFSKDMEMCEVSHGKRDPDLRHFAIAAVYSSRSGRCCYHRLYKGNIPDVNTIEDFCSTAAVLGLKGRRIVADRGFCSWRNIYLVKHKLHCDMLTCLKRNTGAYGKAFNALKGTFEDKFECFLPEHDVYGSSTWLATGLDIDGGEKITENFWYHCYWDKQKAASDTADFFHEVEDEVARLNKAVKDGKIKAESLKGKGKERNFTAKRKSFINVRFTGNSTFHFEYDLEKMNEHADELGYFILVSTDNISTKEAIDMYRAKDGVEKVFASVKVDLGFDRAEVKTDESLQGKVFVAFLAGMLVQKIKNCLKENREKLKRSMTYNKILRELETVFSHTIGNKRVWCEVSQRQALIFSCLGVPCPVDKEKVVATVRSKPGPKPKA